jgi:predicted DNA-binding transcriptional regulator AlpA
MRLERSPSLVELPGDALVRAEQVAQFIGCSRDTVRRAGIPFVAITPRVKRYRVSDVRSWIAAQVRGAA